MRLNENIIYQYIDEELNSIFYKEDIKNDKRNYLQYYSSLIKIRPIIFFTFYNGRESNILFLKISLFVTLISLYFFIKTLF